MKLITFLCMTVICGIVLLLMGCTESPITVKLSNGSIITCEHSRDHSCGFLLLSCSDHLHHVCTTNFSVVSDNLLHP